MAALALSRPIIARRPCAGFVSGRATAVHQQTRFGFKKTRRNIAYGESLAGPIGGSGAIRHEDRTLDLKTTLETGKARIWTMRAFRKRAADCCEGQSQNKWTLPALIRGVKVQAPSLAQKQGRTTLFLDPVSGLVPPLEDQP